MQPWNQLQDWSKGHDTRDFQADGVKNIGFVCIGAVGVENTKRRTIDQNNR